ncbi:rhamnogalacturonan acetylesterase [uncultured Draconibacterium sp.]|uniref:rhamnogalacturonan acetylesterase n=1 Tax=uncultured Draconibacterium sp. TaxID=1573823 RepID=UPI0025DDCDFE|nr:rhamnogalacturonan acetylesterase [uncultured Draconibacterium sp.]
MRKLILIIPLFLFAFSFNITRPVHIFMIGDSTMANKPEKNIPENGWGQVLHYFFNDSVVVDNHARNGRSSKSFIDEGRWETVISKLQKGDYVIIQFGHNDSKPDEERHTDAFSSYKENLTKYIVETKEKGGIPILCTSIVRRHFNEDGTLKDTHGDYLVAARQVAKETEVYFIDMEAKTKSLVEEMGVEKSKQLYLYIKQDVFPLRPKELKDNTHLSQFGAFSFAGLAVEGMKENNIPIIKYLVN